MRNSAQTPAFRQQHYPDGGQDNEAIPRVRRITAEDVRGFVGRSDELDRIARLLAPGAPRGGPLVLCPADLQPGIGVTSLAVQAASRAVAAGWFDGGAVLVSPHAGGERRQVALGRTLANVLAVLGEGGGWGPDGEQAAYQRVMEAHAAAGKPVLIVIEEVLEPDGRLVDWLAAGGPHQMLLTALEPLSWMVNARRLPVRYLTEDESVDVLAAALAPDFSGSSRPPDPPAHLRVLAPALAGVAQALRTVAGELAERPSSRSRSCCRLSRTLTTKATTQLGRAAVWPEQVPGHHGQAADPGLEGAPRTPGGRAARHRPPCPAVLAAR